MFYSSCVSGVDMIRVAGSTTGAQAMSSSALSTIYGHAVSTVSLPTVSTIPAVMEFAMIADGQLQNRQMIFDRATATVWSKRTSGAGLDLDSGYVYVCGKPSVLCNTCPRGYVQDLLSD